MGWTRAKAFRLLACIFVVALLVGALAALVMAPQSGSTVWRTRMILAIAILFAVLGLLSAAARERIGRAARFLVSPLFWAAMGMFFVGPLAGDVAASLLARGGLGEAWQFAASTIVAGLVGFACAVLLIEPSRARAAASRATPHDD